MRIAAIPRLLRPLLLLTAVGSTACPKGTGTLPYEVAAPREMSRHATALLLAYPAAEEEPTPPVTVSVLLAPPECRVEVLTKDPTSLPRVAITPLVAGPCAFALDLDAGGVHWRIDRTIRFLDVPTLVPIEGSHWLDACPGATYADRAENVIACGDFESTTIVTGSESTRLDGRLTATDGEGGWVVCTDEQCRVRDRVGAWHVVDDAGVAQVRWMPLADPPDTFVAGVRAPEPRFVSRSDGRSDKVPARSDRALYVMAAGRRLVDTSESTPGAGDWTWAGWIDGGWRAFDTGGVTYFPARMPFEAMVATGVGALAMLAVDVRAWRLEAHVLDRLSLQLALPQGRGLDGTDLVLMEEDATLRLARLSSTGLDTIALAPSVEPARGERRLGRLASILVTEDAVVSRPTLEGETVRLRVAP